MDLTDVSDLKIALQLAGLKAAKGLGQHFLIDKTSLQAVMVAGELQPDDTVIEIGPGLGVMTLPLTRKVNRVIAVETDSHLAELLRRDKPTNLEVVEQDIMQFNLRSLEGQYKVVANIPYYLTSAILRMFLEAENKPRVMSVLIQKEVAERVTAEPGQMSVLALSVQYYGNAEYIQTVERYKFWPAPKVDSAILQIKLYDKPVFEADPSRLFRLIKAGFGEKRKMLKNSLAGGLNISLERSALFITDSELESTVRAQELGLSDWARLYRTVEKADIL